jgi:LmbE family N-acetylglucosaminyl deacetylase
MTTDEETASNSALMRSRRVLVVAPHPDDETLGCGGLITRLAQQGSSLYIVFMTDGGASHRGSRAWSRARLAACREQEAIEALTRLGAGGELRAFFRLADAAMPARKSQQWAAAITKLETILRSFQPDLALLPWRRDPHCDHRDSWWLAKEALRRADARPLILEYAIWLEEFGAPADHPRPEEAKAIHIDVSCAIGQKRAAIAAHQSQTTALIDDDPDGFRLSTATIARLTGATEKYWRPIDEIH